MPVARESYGPGPITKVELDRFIFESNRLAGVYMAGKEEADAARAFLMHELPTVSVLEPYVRLAGDNGVLREFSHQIPIDASRFDIVEGNPMMRHLAAQVLDRAVGNAASPFLVHCEFMRLSPFSSGNGQAGRLIWLWQMLRFGNHFNGSFSEQFYQQVVGDAQEV